MRSSRNHFRILQRRRYEARRFRNPYFKTERNRNWKAILVVALACVGFAAVFGFAFGSSYFAISDVQVSGTESISPDDIRQNVWNELDRRRLLFFHSRNRFLLDEAALRESLSAEYAFESLEIDRTCTWNGNGCVLSIVVREKTSQLLWVSGERVYLVDLHGTVIRELSTQEIESWKAPDPMPSEPAADGTETAPAPQDVPSPFKRLPAFVDVNETSVEVGSSVLSDQEIANVFALEQGLTEQSIGYVRTKIDRLAGKWMAIETKTGYDILIDATGDVSAQLRNLEVLLRDTIKEPDKLQYVDLRFGDHVYYK